MTSKILIMHATSGAGKSTLAKKIAKESNLDYVICSADDYHYFGLEQIPSNYKFDINNLHMAHKTCQKKFIESIDNNVPLVIVDNTNIKQKDYKFYFLTAIERGCEVEFHTIMGGNVEQHFKSNTHNVPRNVIENMLENLKPIPTEINGFTTKEIVYDFKKLRESKE